MHWKVSLCAVAMLAGAAAAYAAEMRVVPSGAPAHSRYAYYLPPCYESSHPLVLYCTPAVRYESVPFIPRRTRPPYQSLFRW